MRLRLVVPAVLGLGTAALAAEPTRLQALSATSGEGVEKVLDGDPATGWSPQGDAEEEGVLLRFEQPLALDGVTLRACTGSPDLSVSLSQNGLLVTSHQPVKAAQPLRLSLTGTETRSVFVRVDSASAGKACLGEIQPLLKGQPVVVAPPRQVAGGVVASSVLAPEDAFRAAFLFDSRLDFGWAEGDKGTGKGQSFTLTLEQPVELVALELWNGYQRSEDHFKKNARAKKLAVSVDGGPAVPLAVKDVNGMQRLALPSPQKGREWKVLVEDVYPGKSYPDLVLSELRLVDAKGPLGVRIAAEAARPQALQKRLEGSPLGKLADRAWKNVCGSADDDSQRRLKLRTRGTFVFYEDETFGDSERHEVFDGAWVVKKDAGPWAAVELFGRRQRSEKNWDPYADSANKETVRIAGGTLEVARVEDLGAQEFQKLVAAWSKGVQSGQVQCVKKGALSYEDLVKRGAFFVRGKALTDLFAAP